MVFDGIRRDDVSPDNPGLKLSLFYDITITMYLGARAYPTEIALALVIILTCDHFLWVFLFKNWFLDFDKVLFS